LLLTAALFLAAAPARAQVPQPVREAAARIAGELARECPLAEANDATAFESCRAQLYGDSMLRAQLPDALLWGRERAEQQTRLAPDTWLALYAPLFMFNGRHQVEWSASEQVYVLRLQAAFRNGLAPGQYPYPFWHDEGEWAAYQRANALVLRLRPGALRAEVAQFTDSASNPPLQAVVPVLKARFDGNWMWTDTAGRTQPEVTLFRGLYHADNPHLRELDRQYRDLALQMRESRCGNCHTPDNPSRMRRLVILSTPAHAAGEIDRLIQSVREDRMPAERGALSAEDKRWLLDSAEAFRRTVRAARDWEANPAAR